MTQYLLFQLFTGGLDMVNPETGVFSRTLSSPALLQLASAIASTVRPQSPTAGRILGFNLGPIAMDQGTADAATTIVDAFGVALATNMAVAVHLDDRMFWKTAGLDDGAIEWGDWDGKPAPPLSLSWVPSKKLAPQMCYESPEVQKFTRYWVASMGQAIGLGYQQLAAAGKPELFAGVFAGWESDLAAGTGYRSLGCLGYSTTNPPADFDNARAVVLQRHISLWCECLCLARIPRDKIYTHVSFSTDAVSAAPWVTINPYSRSGWSNYVWKDNFTQIYGAVGSNPWAQAEGSNVVLGPGGPSASPLDWQTYLTGCYNQGAQVVTIFGAFQGATGGFQAATSAEAIAAYQRFLANR